MATIENPSFDIPEGIFKSVKALPSFERDFKRLRKRYRTLGEDLHVFIKTALKLFHKSAHKSDGISHISGLGITYPPIYKVKRFACRSLKGKGSNSGMRIIYAYKKDTDEINFVEIYYKGDKENEDKDRILKEFS